MQEIPFVLGKCPNHPNARSRVEGNVYTTEVKAFCSLCDGPVPVTILTEVPANAKRLVVIPPTN
jgi:hypothetical protein